MSKFGLKIFDYYIFLLISTIFTPIVINAQDVFETLNDKKIFLATDPPFIEKSTQTINLVDATTPVRNTIQSRLNCEICESHKFIWFGNAKAGSSTIKYILGKNKINFDFTCREYSKNPQSYTTYFKFAFVRNPWDRVVSAYEDKVTTKSRKQWAECFDKGFDYFVDFIDRQDIYNCDSHIRLQTARLPLDDLDFIGRLENFSNDLLHIFKTIGIDDCEIPKRNSTEHLHYSHYYNGRTKEIIARKYKEDIEAFGYQFENELPKE